MGQTDTRTVTTPLLYALWCERGRRESEKLASTRFIAVYSRSGFWVMFQLLRVTLEESMRFESFDWLIFTRTNALYRPVSVCPSVCHKSSWNEPYSSSSFTKLSCSKMAFYRWIKKTDSRWNKQLISLSSPDWPKSLRRSLERKRDKTHWLDPMTQRQLAGMCDVSGLVLLFLYSR